MLDSDLLIGIRHCDPEADRGAAKAPKGLEVVRRHRLAGCSCARLRATGQSGNFMNSTVCPSGPRT